MVLLSVSPTPTTFALAVFMADVAMGAAMYNIRARCRSVKPFMFMSMFGELLDGLKLRSERLLKLAPASP